jgi:hypothetical protein
MSVNMGNRIDRSVDIIPIIPVIIEIKRSHSLTTSLLIQLFRIELKGEFTTIAAYTQMRNSTAATRHEKSNPICVLRGRMIPNNIPTAITGFIIVFKRSLYTAEGNLKKIMKDVAKNRVNTEKSTLVGMKSSKALYYY